MIFKKIVLSLLTISAFAQHYEKPANFSRHISHFEVSAYELYAWDLIFGAPNDIGLSEPIYRVENFEDYAYKVVDIKSGSMLNTYVSGERVMYSKYGTFWALKSRSNPGQNVIYEIVDKEPSECHASEIFHEGELVHISELSNQYLTLLSHQTINNYSIDGYFNWSYRYPHGDLTPDEVLLSSNETLLIINKADVRVTAIDMTTGEEAWDYQGRYEAQPFAQNLNSEVILFDHDYDRARIINHKGKKLFELERPGDLRATTFLNGNSLVSGNIVIPNLKDDERRIRLPAALGTRGNGPLTPISWSTEGNFFAIVYGFQEKLDPPDSTVQRYRVDVVSANGREMGYFFPRFRDKLDHNKIQIQISNDGSQILFTGAQREGLQFVYRKYDVSL